MDSWKSWKRNQVKCTEKSNNAINPSDLMSQIFGTFVFRGKTNGEKGIIRIEKENEGKEA